MFSSSQPVAVPTPCTLTGPAVVTVFTHRVRVALAIWSQGTFAGRASLISKPQPGTTVRGGASKDLQIDHIGVGNCAVFCRRLAGVTAGESVIGEHGLCGAGVGRNTAEGTIPRRHGWRRPFDGGPHNALKIGPVGKRDASCCHAETCAFFRSAPVAAGPSMDSIDSDDGRKGREFFSAPCPAALPKHADRA
jgi:hypothetical protein